MIVDHGSETLIRPPQLAIWEYFSHTSRPQNYCIHSHYSPLFNLWKKGSPVGKWLQESV